MNSIGRELVPGRVSRRLVDQGGTTARARPLALAEDACCFAWLQLLRNQPERERVVGWLRVVVRHEALRLQRQQWGTRPLEVPTREGWDGQTGEPLTFAERIPAPVDTELAVERARPCGPWPVCAAAAGAYSS